MQPFARGKVLRRIADGIRARAAAIAEVETRNGGKTIANSLNEVDSAANVFEYYAGAMDKFFGDTIPMGANVLDFTLREPLGVVAAITPWNFPFLAAAWKVAPALAAGCTVILKPASYTPLTALMLGEVALEAGVPPGVLNILPGPGAELGVRIATHPAIDKISFTGETATGAKLLKLGADDIKRITLELGGKSPNIVFADADIAKAAGQAVKAGFGNAGQSCSARTRVFVERGAHDEFLAGVRRGDAPGRDRRSARCGHRGRPPGVPLAMGHCPPLCRHRRRGRLPRGDRRRPPGGPRPGRILFADDSRRGRQCECASRRKRSSGRWWW